MFSSVAKNPKVKLVREIGLSVAIVFYLSQAIASLSPDSSLKTAITEHFDNAWQFCGLTQSWSLFSPLIRTINFHVVTIITFEDGTMQFWQLPRMDRLDLYQRFRLEKFRKWDVDSLPWPDYKSFWPDFARFAGRLYYSPTHKPKQLSLVMEYADIPPAKGDLVDRYELPAHVKPNTVFTYFYTPQDFE